MIMIKPVSDLRNNFSTISEICHSQDEPIFFTKNGSGDLVVMSIEAYEKVQARLNLLQHLAEAEAEARLGQSAGSHSEVIARLRQKIK